LVDLAVQPGQKVQTGDRLAVIEAMKMENILTAVQDCTVGELQAKGRKSGRRPGYPKLCLKTKSE
jgi:propionyl-CoA carboxylase alpha chain